MGIITVARGSYSYGQEIAEKVAKKLGYDCISREVILEASELFNIPEIKLVQAFEDAPSILDRFVQGKKKYIAYTRAVLLQYLAKGNVVYHGFAGHFFIEGISHVLKILITADIEKRVDLVMERDGISRKEACRLIGKIDSERRRWCKTLYGIDPWNPTLYDLTFHIGRIGVEDAVDTICRMSRLEQFQITPESEKAIHDLVITAKVEKFLLDARPKVDIHVDNKFVYLKLSNPLTETSEIVCRMGEIMTKIPDISGIEVIQ
ncbi:response regulator receiver protein [sediment metagenome]|uniref:Response regulator receiver protein n=1 Tax=sediment metagenome TaxID=749907 RepID=D9PHQ0_9ZZZZ